MEQALDVPYLHVQISAASSLQDAEQRFRSQLFDIVLWSTTGNVADSISFQRLAEGCALPPTILVVRADMRDSLVESENLARLVEQRVIRDYVFEDEMPILLRSIRRIAAEEKSLASNPVSAPNRLEPTSLLRAVLEACPMAIIGVSATGKVLSWSPGAQQIFGWTENEVLGKSLPTVPEGSEHEFGMLLEAQLLGISQQGSDVVRWTKSHDLISLQLWTAPLRDSDGRIDGKISILADMSNTQRAQQGHSDLVPAEHDVREQVHSTDHFRELLETAPDAIIETDADGNIVLLNAATEQIFGYARSELLGRSVDLLVPSELRGQHPHHRSAYAHCPVRRPMGSGLHLSGQRKDGTRFPVEISLSPVKDGNGLGVSAVIRDVTERQRAEDRFRDLQTRLTAELSSANRELELRSREAENANRLKSEFLASISHELRTPLHTIIGFSELLAEQLEGPLNEKQARFANHIHRDSLHLLELINDILDLSKIEAGKLDLHLEVFDAADAVSEVINSMSSAADAKNIVVTFEPRRPLMLRADRVRLKQILLNLLSNAVKFTPKQGAVSVECLVEDDLVRFHVIDTGLGIPKEEQQAIFDKFHQVGSTTNGVREGTGLGLAITRHLVERHGGSIEVESEPGVGSRFSFSLPPS